MKTTWRPYPFDSIETFDSQLTPEKVRQAIINNGGSASRPELARIFRTTNDIIRGQLTRLKAVDLGYRTIDNKREKVWGLPSTI